MRNRHAHLAPLALVFLAAATAAAQATPASTARVRGEKEPLVAREVVVQVKVDAHGEVFVTPDPAIVRTGQKLVLSTCCNTLVVEWKAPEKRVPKPRCEGNECTLVGPAVTEPVTVDYNIFGKCGDVPFKRDPRLIFTK